MKRWQRLAREAGRELAEMHNVLGRVTVLVGRAGHAQRRTILRSALTCGVAMVRRVESLTERARWWARWLPWL